MESPVISAQKSRLSRLLQPQSVAVFGGAWAVNVIKQLQDIGFAGAIWPVHPSKSEVLGLPCYRAIADLPAPPDASFIGVNRTITPEILAALNASGAGGAICFASGFAETAAEEDTGSALQSELVIAAGDMPFLGPNCYGFVNYLDAVCLWPDQHGGKPESSGVAIIMQSSNIAINLTMQQRSCPIAYMVTAGNQAAVSQADIALELLLDERVTAIGLHIEGFVNLDDWHRLAQAARAAGKPIIALKMGKSEQAQKATRSHTASLAGSDAGADALLNRLGIARVDSLTAFLETLKFLHYGGLAAGPKLASLSCSGGEASLVADAAFGLPLSFPALSHTQKAQLERLLGGLVHLSNPLDYQTYIWGDVPVMTGVFATMLAGEADLGILIFDPPRADRCDASGWLPALDAFLAAAKQTGKPVAVIATIPELMTEEWAAHIAAAGGAPMCGLDDALSAFVAADFISKKWESGLVGPDLPDLITRELPHQLDEAAAKHQLRIAGLPVPQGQVANTPEEAGLAAAAIGFPVVLKGLGIAHKTEAGAVRIKLPDAEAVILAAEDMVQAKGFLVEQMIEGVIAELLVGVIADPAHGLVLTIGAGGTLTEIHQDTQSLILPASDAEIEAALNQLRLAPILYGYRGSRAANIQNIIGDIQAIAQFALGCRDNLSELEINPYLVRAQTGIIADCLFITKSLKKAAT